jgi:Mn2+/Fe2+ NRAMP family transporter
VDLTPEDLSRSKDRPRVLDARQKQRAPMLLWLLSRPGVLAMLGENDGPSMISYAATGASYEIGFFLPFIAVAFLAANVVQEMAMRLGAVTHRGYGELIFQRFGPFWGWLSASDLVFTNLITLITEIIAIRLATVTPWMLVFQQSASVDTPPASSNPVAMPFSPSPTPMIRFGGASRRRCARTASIPPVCIC